MMETMYHTLLYAMPVLAVIVFIALFFVKAGYGIFQSRQWGISLPNKVGWVLMECPAFLMMLFFWLQSPARSSSVLLSFFLLFELHYFQRSFIFPMLMKGKSRMPIAITAMGVLFNVINTFLIGYDLFYLHASTYTEAWFTTPSFIGGCLLFFGGMGINPCMPTTLSVISVRQETPVITCPRKESITMSLQGTISANWWNGQDLPSLPSLPPPGFSYSGPSPTWLRALMPSGTATAKNSENRYREEFGREAVGSRKCLIPYIF